MIRNDTYKDEPSDFVLSFCDHAENLRAHMHDVWDEVEDNFILEPFGSGGFESITKYPFLDTTTAHRRAFDEGYAILKDPETHQELMTLLATLVLRLFPDDQFVRAAPVGLEDTGGGRMARALLERFHRLPGHFWVTVFQFLNALIQGTGICRVSYEYQEGVREFRSATVDPILGGYLNQTQLLRVPIWDDPMMEITNGRDFFEDPSAGTIARMAGCAHRIRMKAHEIEGMAEAGIYRRGKVREALDVGGKGSRLDSDEDPKRHDQAAHESFREHTCLEYFGIVPWNPKDGIESRVITVVNGVTVRNDPWPRRLPFFEIKLIPRPGNKFWGVGIGEVLRYDQDFADTLKMLLAEAIVRSTHPPLIFDVNQVVDASQLRLLRPRVPIAANSTEAVQQLQYNPPVGPGFQLYSGLKQQMRQASGALDALQGLGLGVDRASATEAGRTYDIAMTRPELWASLCEKEWLPQIGQYVLELYQQTLEDDQDIAQRIGESEMAGSFFDLLIPYDVRYVGARHELSKNQELASFREIAQAAGGNPVIAQMVPWPLVLRRWYERLGAYEVARAVANPQLTQLQGQMLQQGRASLPNNGNNLPPGQAPLQLPPAQAEGASGE